mgnify:FL=1
MSRFLNATPGIKLLIPAVIAIVISIFIAPIPHALALSGIGVIIIIISYLIPEKHEYNLRWLFSAGAMIAIFFIFAHLTQTKQEAVRHQFSESKESYIGTLYDYPQEKNKSFACDIKITYPIKKNIVLYFQKDSILRELEPGMEIVFYTTLQPFKNFGNPDDFDYAGFMHNKGFSGSGYVPSTDWTKTNRTKSNLKTFALKSRQKALELYRNLNLSDDAYSFISALTLGYKQDLTGELKEAFRTSGTSHVLAVSGLHVGVVYMAISFIFSFLGKRRNHMIIKQILIILALWSYALLTGMSPSVMRATIMLTIMALAVALNEDTYHYNTLSITAFLILLFNPLYLLDVGFQMSFAAVIAILFFNQKISKLYQPKNKIIKYIWSLFTVSTSAQLGVFPIALYYFGTFPTYFFISNMVIVPLVGLIIYAMLPVLIITPFANIGFEIFNHIFNICQWILKTLIDIVIKTVYIIESLPLAQISEISITTIQLFSLLISIYAFFLFLERKRANHLIAALSSILILTTSVTISKVKPSENKFVVFNTPNYSDIGLFVNNKRLYPPFGQNNFLPIKDKRVLHLSQNIPFNYEIDNRIKIDVLILSDDKAFSINGLARLFDINTIVFDNTLPQYLKNRWQKECATLGIITHDVSQDGAFIIKL